MKSIIFKSAIALTLLSTTVMSSTPLADPLAELSFARQNSARVAGEAYAAQAEALETSMTAEQRLMQRSLAALRILCPAADRGTDEVATATLVGSDLEVVVSGNMSSYPKFLNALLTA